MRRQTQPGEQPHRNHGLFSDQYLNVTLPERPDWRALAVEAAGALEEVSRILAAYTPSANETQVEEELVRPVLRLLGHEGTFEVQPALATLEGTKRPDYVLYRDAASLDDERLRGRAFAGVRPLSPGGGRIADQRIRHPAREQSRLNLVSRAEAARLERRLSDLVNEAYALTPEETDLLSRPGCRDFEDGRR